jgi:hypothetical protein
MLVTPRAPITTRGGVSVSGEERRCARLFRRARQQRPRRLVGKRSRRAVRRERDNDERFRRGESERPGMRHAERTMTAVVRLGVIVSLAVIALERIGDAREPGGSRGLAPRNRLRVPRGDDARNRGGASVQQNRETRDPRRNSSVIAGESHAHQSTTGLRARLSSS